MGPSLSLVQPHLGSGPLADLQREKRVVEGNEGISKFSPKCRRRLGRGIFRATTITTTTTAAAAAVLVQMGKAGPVSSRGKVLDVWLWYCACMEIRYLETCHGLTGPYM